MMSPVARVYASYGMPDMAPTGLDFDSLFRPQVEPDDEKADRIVGMIKEHRTVVLDMPMDQSMMLPPGLCVALAVATNLVGSCPEENEEEAYEILNNVLRWITAYAPGCEAMPLAEVEDQLTDEVLEVVHRHREEQGEEPFGVIIRGLSKMG